MAKKRRTSRHWPGCLMALAAVCLLLTLDGPHGAAVNSPLSNTVIPKADTPIEEQAASPEESEKPEEPESGGWYGPVPESAAVSDDYFDDAVFLGDSRTDGFRLYSGLNRGVYLCATGATVESVFTKEVETPLGTLPLLDALAETECGKIYVMLGVNELGWPGTSLFRDQTENLIRRLQEDHPQALILLQAILPVSARQDAKGSYVNNRRIQDYNAVLLELAEETGIFYISVDDPLTGEDGCLPADLNYDGVHLNPDGCAIWLDYLRSHTIAAEHIS